MVQANESDFGRRVGPVEYGTPETTPPPPGPADTSMPSVTAQNTPAPTPTATAQAPETPATPTFWDYNQGQKAGTLEPTFGAKIAALIKAAQGKLWIGSGFRDSKKQAGLYQEAIAKHGAADAGNWAAPPGHSNHERGEAADIFGNFDLLHQLAPQFGLTFPMSWEPWHVEPVGLRKQSSPQAYTNNMGSQNPTTDASLDSAPHEVAASISNLFTGGAAPKTPGASLAQATTGGLIGGAPNTLTGNYNIPTVTGTRTGTVAAPTSYTSTGGTGATAAPQQASQSQQAYISEIRPFAEAESKRTGIPAEVMIVQSGLETGWGTSGWWTNNRNPAGIGVTGAAGAGNSYPDLATAFHDYAEKLLGHGEAGQEKFAADVAAGASSEQLLADIQQSPWAAGHYGGNGLVSTYQALAGGGAFTPAKPAAPSPAASQPAAQPANQRRNRAF